MAKKLYKYAVRCPKYRNSFESIKSCLISIERNDGSSQTIRTQPAFLQLDKNEKLETKVQLLSEAVSGLTGVKSYSYQIS